MNEKRWEGRLGREKNTEKKRRKKSGHRTRRVEHVSVQLEIFF